MVIPRASRQVLSYRIPVGAVYGFLLLLLIGAFCTGNALLRSAELHRSRAEVVRLSGENRLLTSELGGVQDRLGTLTEDLAALTLFEEKIRTVAALDLIHEDVKRVGIGGPGIGGGTDLLRLDPDASDRVVEMVATQNDVGTVTRQVRLLSESFSEVLETLEERSEELAHTPSIMPVDNCWLTDRFGYRMSRFTGRREMHSGQDMSARKGEPVVATADGVVKFTGRRGNLGLAVEIDHGGGITTRYGHAYRIFVERGQEVVRGQVIAAVGSSGRSTNPHLHYEVRIDGRPVNPLKYIIRSDRFLD